MFNLFGYGFLLCTMQIIKTTNTFRCTGNPLELIMKVEIGEKMQIKRGGMVEWVLRN